MIGKNMVAVATLLVISVMPAVINERTKARPQVGKFANLFRASPMI